jgi:hypothetical protein
MGSETPQPETTPHDRPTAISPAAANDDLKRTIAAFGLVVERIAPWLFDLGNWVFGALIAFNLLVLGALLTVGPVDAAVIVSAAALAISLPIAAAGFLLLKLAQDIKRVGLEQVTTEAFEKVGFEFDDKAAANEAPEVGEKRRTARVLRYCYALLVLSASLTLISVTAALWHMAWWIGLAFIAAVVAAQVVVLNAFSYTGANASWRSASGAEEPRGK